MAEIYISNVLVKNIRTIQDFNIPISDEQRKNLIITGKNGSGKTTLANEIVRFFDACFTYGFQSYQGFESELIRLSDHRDSLKSSFAEEDARLSTLNNQINSSKALIDRFGGTVITIKNESFMKESFAEGNFIICFLEAKRNTSLKTPTGINKINFKNNYKISEQARTDFIQHIVNLKADRSFANDDNDLESVTKIDDWFALFEDNILSLFDKTNVKLQFDRKQYNFNLVEGGKPPYNLNQLSDGYSAILSIVTELIMRMETHRTNIYDVQGIVIIDEIETHLHIDLQKKVLPFLTAFFPKIQFIVTTHSPFVITSVENAVICDLEKGFITEDLTGYSYDAIIEGYFGADKYSNFLKKQVSYYEQLVAKSKLTDLEKNNLEDLKLYFNELPKFISDELVAKLQQIRLFEIEKQTNK